MYRDTTFRFRPGSGNFVEPVPVPVKIFTGSTALKKL